MRIVTLLDRLKMFFGYLREPTRKPSSFDHLERRQDEVAKRLDKVMTSDGANRGQRALHDR